MTTRRHRILDAAAELFAERGFAQSSVDDVIERAGLSGKSHFYHYFRSKDELGHEVITRHFDLMGERGLAILADASLEPLERLNQFIDSVVAVQAASGFRGGSPFGALATEMADSDDRFRVRIAAVFREWTGAIARLLELAAGQLEEDTDPERLARFIVATLEGATTMARMKQDAAVMHGVASDLKRFVAGHVRRPISF